MALDIASKTVSIKVNNGVCHQDIGAGSAALTKVPGGKMTSRGLKHPSLAITSEATKYFKANLAALLPAAAPELIGPRT
jgi:hypothetical protein